MSEIATITSKGQVTIPKPIRDALGVVTGDRISFTVQPDGTVRLATRKRSLDSIAGMLHRPATRRRSVEEMDEAIGRHLAKSV